jgi:hypothetical protein
MMVYTAEAAIRQMKPPITSITNIIDIKGVSGSFDLAMRVKAMLDRVSDNYIERNHRMIVINAGWAITWMWAGISIFIPKHVVDKFTFIGYEEEEIKNTLLNIIDDEQLVIYNGKEYSYNQERELKKELEIYGE